MQTTAQLSASALPAVQDQATLTKLFGLHSQWTHFDMKNADILNAIAHMAENHSASCHSPIHAIVSLLLPDIQLQTPSASAVLHLSWTAVALTCIFRKVVAARQLHALVSAFQFCQVALEVHEPGDADTLIVVDQGHQLKAMFVLLKLFRHHAIHSPANEACLGDAARASADVSLCKSLEEPSANLMQNAVEDSCIVAVAVAHSALSVIKHALKEIDFMSAPKNCTACVVLMTLLHHPMPQVPAQAAAVIVESGGLLLFTALLQRPIDGRAKMQAFVVIYSLLVNDHGVPEVLKHAAESLLNRLQASYSIASLLDMGDTLSQSFGQMVSEVPGACCAAQTLKTQLLKMQRSASAYEETAHDKICWVLQKLFRHQAVPLNPLEALPTPTATNARHITVAVCHILAEADPRHLEIQAASRPALASQSSSFSLWAVVHGLVIGHLPNLELNVWKLAQSLLPLVWLVQGNSRDAHYKAELGLALMRRLARDNSIIAQDVSKPDASGCEGQKCKGCPECQGPLWQWKCDVVDVIQAELCISAEAGKFQEATAAADALYVALACDEHRKRLVSSKGQGSQAPAPDTRRRLETAMAACDGNLDCQLTIFACLVVLETQRVKLFRCGGDEKVLLQTTWQTDDAWASFLEAGFEYIKQAVHERAHMTDGLCVALIRALCAVGDLQANSQDFPPSYITLHINLAVSLLDELPRYTESIRLHHQLLQAMMLFMTKAWQHEMQHGTWDTWGDDTKKLCFVLINLLEDLVPEKCCHPTETPTAYSEAGLPVLEPAEMQPFVLGLMMQSAPIACHFGVAGLKPCLEWLSNVSFREVNTHYLFPYVNLVGRYGETPASTVSNPYLPPPPKEGFSAMVLLSLFLAQAYCDQRLILSRLHPGRSLDIDQCPQAAPPFGQILEYVLTVIEEMQQSPVWGPIVQAHDWEDFAESPDPAYSGKLSVEAHLEQLARHDLLPAAIKQRLNKLCDFLVDQPVRGPAPPSAAEAAAAAAAAEAAASAAAEQLLAEEAQAASKAASKKAKKLKQKAKKQQKRHATVDTSGAVSADQSGETAETSSLDDLTLDSLADTAMELPYVGLYTTPREASSRKAGLPSQLPQVQGASLLEQEASCSMNGTSEDANGQQTVAAAIDTAKAERSLSLGALFCCPITQAIMIEPVIAADGHSYERSALEEWLRGHDTSPVTGQPLPHCRIVPNVLIRNAIRASQHLAF